MTLDHQRTLLRLLGLFAFNFFITAFVFNSPIELIEGYQRILRSPSILITDYFVIGNIGSAFLNASIMMSIGIVLVLITKVKVTGSVVAALFTVAGFALFGKNSFNIWPIFIGVYLYAKLQREPFSKYVVLVLFATAFSPLVSQIAYGFKFDPLIALPLSYLLGIFAGFMFPPLAAHFVKFHQGYNLYNIGFTSGIIGMVFMALFRSFGLNNDPTFHVAEGNNLPIGIFLGLYFTGMLVIGLRMSPQLKTDLKKISQSSGKLGTDFFQEAGIGATLINMALLGFMATGYILLVQAELSGPALGGIFTVVGFGAVGKQLKTTIPVILGVYIATAINIWDTHAPSSVLAALFGTTLAPIAGVYGPIAGVVAGFFHMVVVMNVGVLHGGMNLYNNGFSGGFVAAVLVPILDAIRKPFISNNSN